MDERMRKMRARAHTHTLMCVCNFGGRLLRHLHIFTAFGASRHCDGEEAVAATGKGERGGFFPVAKKQEIRRLECGGAGTGPCPAAA